MATSVLRATGLPGPQQTFSAKTEAEAPAILEGIDRRWTIPSCGREWTIPDTGKKWTIPKS